MRIQLENWKLQNLKFSIIDEERDENSFSLSTANHFFEKESQSFGVEFQVEIKDKKFDLELEMNFIFKLDEVVSEDFKLSDFPKINAPAIAFPYLRAFISNFSLQSGFEPIILPSINFVNLIKEDESQNN